MAKSEVKQRPVANVNKLPPIMDALDVALLYGISVQSVRRMARRGEIPATKIGKRIWRFRREDVINAISKGGIAV